MSGIEITFWSAALCVVYTYVLYPLMIGTLARLRPRKVNLGDVAQASVSIIIAARNESTSIGRRLGEFCTLLDVSQIDGEIILVSDGSTDRTVDIARDVSDARIRVVDLRENVGKAEAISRGAALASGDILVFADARQRWSDGSLRELLRPLADAAVGAVSGELVIDGASGANAGVGFYWRFEKWLRTQESRFHSSVGVTGAICAVRRSLFRPIPRGTILDDVYWPLAVVMQRYRVVMHREAVAYDVLPENSRDEFRRKLRTLSGNFQLVCRTPGLLLPWRNPVWLQLYSHKLMRLLVPWALLVMLAASFTLNGPFYQALLVAQLLFYAVGLAGLLLATKIRSRLSSAAAAFLMLNVAAWLSFWVWLFGRAGSSWSKVSYSRASAKVARAET